MHRCGERFLCDEMLARVGRWLRAAGYDTAIAKAGEEDVSLLHRARREGRLIITRDRNMHVQQGDDVSIILLKSNSLAEQLRELSEHCDIEWLHKPFSRCMECNSILVEAAEQVRHRVPPASLVEGETLLYCTRCDKPYWNGSHVRRMRRKLEQLNAGIWDGAVDEE